MMLVTFHQVIFILAFPWSITFVVFAGGQCKSQKSSEFGFVLIDHVFESFPAEVLVSCYFSCNARPDCQSLNFNLANKICQLNNETRHSRPEKLMSSDFFVYAENPNRAFLGSVSTRAAKSCKQIIMDGDSTGDGEYWMDPEGSGNSFKAFCDMRTDGGGWLLVANLVLESSSTPSSWTPSASTYTEISNYDKNRLGITVSAMNQLRIHAQYSQLRFHCRKEKGTTFHVKTTLDSKGEAVVQYFSGQTEVLPGACDSFIRMEGDTSRLATKCSDWGNDHGHHVGKWGHHEKKGEDRLYNHAAFVAQKYHWNVNPGECDDDSSNNLSSGDFWRVYVR
ncbi:PREDICTED: uncharacterized protein LOC107350695 [Acropora digitifera]|uniref:uncharacterized protein LOC107350695 n=1 Tax=Acropora digitifera TaxID=70779 RepID=UPI00077AA3BD|nr:PREDICTED: uncharacterized protein LOC107350695 [Acropora digitifera]